MDTRPNDKAPWTDDLLRGAEEIGAYIGEPASMIYYFHRTRRWPISKFGRSLVASKRQLDAHAAKITKSTAA